MVGTLGGLGAGAVWEREAGTDEAGYPVQRRPGPRTGLLRPREVLIGAAVIMRR